MKWNHWIILVLALLLMLCCGAAAETGGTCGDNLTWTLDDNGVLTISGTGEMDSYVLVGSAPWVGMDVRSVIIEEGVTSVGSGAFQYCGSVLSVELPDTVASINDRAFYNCHNLAEITIPSSVNLIGETAFYDCDSLTEISLPAGLSTIGRGAFSGCSSLLSIAVDGGNAAYSSIDGVLYDKLVTAVITCPAGKQGTFTVPNSVTSINGYAFAECAGLTEIVIPDSVSNIESSAFYSCTGLTGLVIPDGIQTINMWVFQSCTNLRQVAIPVSVKSINPAAFGDCSNLSDVYYGGAEAQWSEIYIYSDNDVLQDVEVHYHCHGFEPAEIVGSGECGINVTWTLDNTGMLIISGSGDMEFSGSTPPWGTSITSVEIESGVTSICDNAFYRCGSLTWVSIPDSVTGIGTAAFSSCTGLRNVTLPESVTSIGSDAFNSCSNLRDIALSDSIISIGPYAFFNCYNLMSITLPDSVTSIGAYAFHNCSGLAEITIPAGVTSIGQGAFECCRNLSGITVAEGNSSYTSVDGVLYNKLQTTLLACPGGETGVFSIPETVDSIWHYAFTGCRNLQGVIIPDSVTFIGSAAFEECNSLQAIVIPDSVTSISTYVFAYCYALTEVTIPDHVTDIGTSAFYYCSALQEVTIPAGVESIGYNSFTNCSSLASVIIENPYVSFITSDGGSGGSSGNPIFGNEAAVTLYAAAGSTAEEFAAEYGLLFVPTSVPGETEGLLFTLNGDGTFSVTGYTGTDPEVVILSEHEELPVTGIGERAFINNTAITAVTIPASVTAVGPDAFDGCTSLQDIWFEGTEEQWSAAAGAGQTWNGAVVHYKYKSPEIVDSGECGIDVTWTLDETGKLTISGTGEMEISGSTPPWGTTITSVEIESGVTGICDYAFFRCGRLNKVLIADSVTSIGTHAFDNCSGLKNITLPDSIISIGMDAFYYCSGLTEITIPAGTTNIASAAFACCPNLSGITVAEGNPSYTSVDGVLYNKQQTSLLACPGGKTGVFSIPDTVDSIGNEAFFGCRNLQGIIIPDSVTFIGSAAFDECSGLQAVVIPSGVTSINPEVFSGCTSLREVTIPAGVTSIGSFTFNNCSALEEVTIPAGVTVIDSYTFYNCSTLEEVTIPSGVSSIGYNSFIGCSSLVSVTIENPDVEFITSNGGSGGSSGNPIFGNEAALTIYAAAGSTAEQFAEEYGIRFVPTGGTPGETEGLWFTVDIEGRFKVAGYTGTDTEVVILSEHEGYPVTGIAGRAFSNNTAITAVSIPGSITAIGEEAFAGCTGLSSITLPSGVSVIGERAFAGCTGLEGVILPASITAVSPDAFDGCTSLQDIWFAGTEEQWSAAAGAGQTWNGAVVHYNSEGPDPEIIASGECGDSLSWTLDEAGLLTVSGSGYMAGHPWTGEYTDSITKVVLEEGVVSICENAFTSCKNMLAIWIPNTIRSVGGAFSGCVRLRDVWYNGISVDLEQGRMDIPMGASSNPAYSPLMSANIHYAESQAAGEGYSVAFSVTDSRTGEEILPVSDGVYEAANNLSALVTVSASDIPGYRKTYRLKSPNAVNWSGPYTPDENGNYTSIRTFTMNSSVFRAMVVYVPEAGGATLVSDETGIYLNGISEGASVITVETRPDSFLLGAGYGYTFSLQLPDGFDPEDVTGWGLSVYKAGTYISYYYAGSSNGDVLQERMTVPEDNILEEGDYSISLTVNVVGYDSMNDYWVFHVYDIRGPMILRLPADLAQVGDEAFAGGAFHAVVIPDGCGYIGHRAFAGCTGLLYVSCPSGIVMEEDAFEGCGEQLVIVKR